MSGQYKETMERIAVSDMAKNKIIDRLKNEWDKEEHAVTTQSAQTLTQNRQHKQKNPKKLRTRLIAFGTAFALVAACAIIVPVVLLSGRLSSGMLKNCRIDMTDVVSFGAVDKTVSSALQDNKQNTSARDTVAAMTTADGAGTRIVQTTSSTDDSTAAETLFVSLDEEENVKVVEFLRNQKVIKQEDLKGVLRHFYVTPTFTFLTFIIKDRYDPRDLLVCQGDYYCGGSQQSYVVHNETGKIYSLEEIPGYEGGTPGVVGIIGDGVVLGADRLIYRLFVENDQLVFTPLTTNPNLGISSGVSDCYGNMYVFCDYPPELPIGNIYFYNSKKLNQYLIGDDGKLYYSESGNWGDSGYDLTLSTFGFYTQQSSTTNLSFWMRIENGIVIARQTYGGFTIRDLSGERGNIYLASNSDYDLFNGTQFIQISKSNKVVHCFDYADYVATGNTTVLEREINFSGYELIDNEIVLQIEGAQSTERYRIAFKNGAIELEPFSRTVYDYKIIAVQPLN